MSSPAGAAPASARGAGLRPPATGGRRRVRVCVFNPWAGGLEPAAAYVRRAGGMDLAPWLDPGADAGLRRKARLDCDWHAENVRCFGAMHHPTVEFLPAFVAGAAGVLDFVRVPREAPEERWVVFTGQQPQALGPLAGRITALLRRSGVRLAFYAFDEASRFMPCFRAIARDLDVLIHDETPLDPEGAAALPPRCARIHRSWVANVVPQAVAFNEVPERRILFLGSQPGLTEHRVRQIAFLQARFKDRFVASLDHSIEVGERAALNRYQVGFCPEGRRFTTPGMSRTHTDRPFWSGCLGLVPVAENSTAGNRLDELAAAGLVLRYDHGALPSLAEACERALEMGAGARRRIYAHFNRHETVGTVLAAAIAGTR